MSAGAPRTRPPVAGVSVLVGLGLLAVGAVALQDVAVGRGWVDGSSWLRWLVDRAGEQEASTGLEVAGGVLVALGVVVLVVMVLRGRRTHLRMEAPVETWVSPRAVAAVALEAADRSPGVLHAAVVSASRRRVVLEVAAARRAGDDRAVTGSAQDAARRAVADVPRARVVVRRVRESA